MPRYGDLRDDRYYTEDEKDWVSRRLLDLRARLKEPPPVGVPERKLRSSLIIGTWNLRDFDGDRFRNGPRRRESLQYIAEIISSFDICAIQEVNEDLGPLQELVRILGVSWDYIATDVTIGSGGNNERMAFVYDTRKVRFRNIAGEIVLPKHNLLPDEEQFARTPFTVSFQAGWFRFALCTVHIYFGDSSKNSDGYKRRVSEIEYIGKELARRADRENENYVLLGDFNIKNPIDETMNALTKSGFVLPPELFPSNLLQSKYYDQIAFRTRKDTVTFLSAGVFDYSKAVFKPEHYDHYAPVLPERHRELDERGRPVDRGKDKEYYSKRWITWQMSDHLPLWVELAIDFSDETLFANLSDEAAERGAPAQIEDEDEDGDPVAIDSESFLRARRKRAVPIRVGEEVGIGTTELQPLPPIKTKKRKKPKEPRKTEVGVAQPEAPMTLGLAWKLFWFVASGRAEKIRKQRKAARKAAKMKKK